MKTILIATDFSDASHNAALYGVKLARLLDAKVILFNAYKVKPAAPALAVSTSRYDVMMQTDKLLLDEADKLDPKKGLIEILCDEGTAEDAIINIGSEKKADFIVMGMKGSGKNLKKIFGSTVIALVKKTNIPAIIVPEAASFKEPGILVFANDSDVELENVSDQLISITKLFQSRLYVVKVIKSDNKEWLEGPGMTQKLKKIVHKLDPDFEYPVDDDVMHALDMFIKIHHANMLVMIPHKHKLRERLFRKSETKEMIFHAKIPLLILPEKMSGNSGKRKKKEAILNS